MGGILTEDLMQETILTYNQELDQEILSGQHHRHLLLLAHLQHL